MRSEPGGVGDLVDVYQRLLGFVRPYRARVAVAVLASLLFAAATSFYAFLLGPLLKLLLTGEAAPVAGLRFLEGLSPERLLVALPALLIATAIVRAGTQALQTFLMQSTGQRVVAEMRRALYRRFLELPQAWLSGSHSGDLISRFGADVQSVEFAVTVAFSSYVKDTLQALALLAVCAWLDLRLLAAAMIAVPLTFIPIARFGRSLKGVSDEAQEKLGALASHAGESVANVRVVQAFCREGAELRRFDEAQGRYLRVMHKSFLLRAAFSPVVELFGILGLALAIYFAGSAIAEGALKGETLLSFLAALTMMYQPIKALSITGQQVIQGMAGARRVFEVLDAPAGLCEPAEAAPLGFEREIAFRGVSFSYSGAEGPAVIQDLDLVLPKGKTLALVGESGAGKSTAALLLLRFWDPTRGSIAIDGRDLRTARLADLRRLIAYVPQEPVLFAGSVFDNVACGNERAGEPEVIAALKAAHAWDLVTEMGGLGAQVGERGSGLSGGQRQRIALARAFVADAPIIVLDEATSALDTASEQLVQQGLERLLRGRTALVIAHRLSTVERADEIAVLSGGRLVERGAHRELMMRGGLYARLWAAQGATGGDAGFEQTGGPGLVRGA